MTLDDVLRAAANAGVANSNTISQLVQPAMLLRPAPGSPRTSPSHLGGRPRLPAGVAWPRSDNRPLAFIAEIDLDSQPQSFVDLGLPARGTLLFFYDVREAPWGLEQADAESFRVIYLESPGQRRATWPRDLPDEDRFPQVSLVPEATVTLPGWDSLVAESLALDKAQEDAYAQLLESSVNEQDWAARCLLGGHPDQIQGDVLLECALVAAGVRSGASDDAVRRARIEARDWRLLLQIPSDDDSGMVWGDGGCLYFAIRAEDLRAHRFDRTWMILQCT